MAVIWMSVILFLFALSGTVTSDFDSDVCRIFEESYGKIPPPLPTNFEQKGEHVDHKQNCTTYEEFYFDYTNLRAKYMFLQNSIEHHFLFDYGAWQIVKWDILHSGVTIKRDPLSQVCIATAMDDSDYRYLFGYQDWPSVRLKMYNSNQVLRFGGQYLYAANGTTKLEDRGFYVNKFNGCLYDSTIEATMFNEYYFTNGSMATSGGTTTDVVTGSENGFLSVPAKLHTKGTMTKDKELYTFEKTISISWFKGKPEFKLETFQIPPWIHCKSYGVRKDMPKFPTAFSTRLAVTQIQVDILTETDPAETESFEEIYYYGEKNLARRDFSPHFNLDTDIYSKFLNYDPVTTIYDFNQGLRYTINKPTGRCYIGPIRDNEYFDTEEPLLYRKLATPEEIFLMQAEDMEYKGQSFVRDINCDIWNGKHSHKKYNATFVKETYFSTNGWHELSQDMVEYGVPVKHMVRRKELDGNLVEGVNAYNFLKFKAKPPRLASFDIQNCVEQISHKRFAILLSADETIRNLIFKYKFQFLETAQYYLSDMTQVMTPLRIQRLHLRQQSLNNLTPFLVFSILDKADLSGSSILVGQKGATLQEAILNLQLLIENGRFAIDFYPPRSKEATVVAAKPGSLYTLSGSGNLTFSPHRKYERYVRKQKATENIATVTEGEKIEGMTSGHLTLLSFAMLFIGIGIGIAIMYLYLRVYTERTIEDRIDLTPQQSVASPKSEEEIPETPLKTI